MTEKRGEPRVTADGRVSYSIGDVVLTDRLLDLSVQGCKLASNSDLAEPGDAVEVTLLQGVVVTGVVKWTQDDVLGVIFDRPVGTATVRYFEVGRLPETESYRPTDRFGRAMPPLGGLAS